MRRKNSEHEITDRNKVGGKLICRTWVVLKGSVRNDWLSELLCRDKRLAEQPLKESLRCVKRKLAKLRSSKISVWRLAERIGQSELTCPDKKNTVGQFPTMTRWLKRELGNLSTSEIRRDPLKCLPCVWELYELVNQLAVIFLLYRWQWTVGCD